MNVLLTTSGRRVALLRAFQEEARRLDPAAKVFAADASSWSAALRLADRGFLVPPCGDPGYVPALLELVRAHAIDVIVPLIDPELPVLARQRGAFLAEGCHVMVSDQGAVDVTRDKGRSAARFRALGFRAPQVFDLAALEHPERLPYPVFVKPAAGSSSVDAQRVDGPEDLRRCLRTVRAPCVQSFERGREYTVDVLVDLAGRARCVVPRERWETRGGEISKGRTTKDARLMAAAAGLAEALGGCRGCVTLQCFDPGEGEAPVFFEANLRFGGGFPLSYAAGANYPRWILQMCAGEEIPVFDGWRDGLVMLRYDDAVFVEAGA